MMNGPTQGVSPLWSLVLLLGVMALVPGCACGNALLRLGLSGGATATPTSQPVTATLPAAITATPAATLLVPTHVPEGNGLSTIPDEPNTPFTMVLSQQQINEYLAEREVSQAGITIRDLQVTLADDALIATFKANQAESGLSGGVTVRGVPRAVDGQLYFRVDDVTLDESIGGLARMLARAAIDQALRQYSTEDGIPVPLDTLLDVSIDVHEIELDPGVMTVTGRTR